MHESVHRLVEDELGRSSVRAVWSGPNVLNGAAATTPELVAQLGAPQDISLDGPREVHDRVRFYTGGRGGTYDDTRAVLDQVLRRHPDMGVSAVLTAYCTDIAKIFSHLYDDVGARNIYMKPVNAPHDVDYALNVRSLPDFQEGYLGLIEHILDRPAPEILSRLLALNYEDFFMRFFYRVKDRAVQTHRCGAGKSGAYVDTNGRLYACAHFIGKSGWHIGDLDNGFDEELRQRFASLTVDSREPCRSCSVRYVCGGGCYYQAVLANGDIAQPDEVKCELIRFLTRLAIRLIAVLREQHPAVLAALPTPFGLDLAFAESPAETAYQPRGRLRPRPSPIPRALHGVGRVRGGLPPQGDLRLGCSMQNSKLTVELTGEGLSQVEAVRVWLQPYGDTRFTLGDVPVLTPYNSGHQLRVTADKASWLATPTDTYRRVPHPPLLWHDAADVVVVREARSRQVTIDLSKIEIDGPSLGINVFVVLNDWRRSGARALRAIR